MSNPYQQIDSTIEQWAKHHGLVLMTHQEGIDVGFRNVYLGSNEECCQIWIDPPQDDLVVVHAAEVESLDDEEIRADWTSSVATLSETLEIAVGFVRTWFNRKQPSLHA